MFRRFQILPLFAVLLAGGLLVGGADRASADTTITVMADSTLDGNAGSIVRIAEPGYPTEEFFGFDEGGMVRIYAARELGDPSGWTVLPGSQFLCPTTTMFTGQTWRGLDTDSGAATTATVEGTETVTTPAGTFSTYRVRIDWAGAAGDYELMWFSSGNGLVKQEAYLGGVWDWGEQTASYTIVGGAGFFPLAVGNTWLQQSIVVANEAQSVGDLKSAYDD